MTLDIELPAGWHRPRVSDIAARRANATVGGPFGSDLVAKDYVDSGVPVIRGQNMGQRYVGGEFAFVSPAKAKALQANLTRPSDLVFTQRGTLGQVALVPSGPYEEYLISQSQMKLTLDCGAAAPGYVHQYFASALGQKQILDSAIQTGVPHTNLGILRNYAVPMPRQVEEQEAIAAALTDADALIDSLEQLLTKKRQIKQGAMQELLTGKRRLPGFGGQWRRCALSEVAEFLKGSGLSKSSLLQDGSIPCIHYGQLFTEYGPVIVDVRNYTDQKEFGIASQAGDVLMPTSDVTPKGLAKASCILRSGVALGGDILVIRPDASLIFGPFLSNLIRSQPGRVLELVTGSTVFHLYGRDMARYQLNLPSVKEQAAIAQVLSDMDAQVTALESRLTKARALKQGMAQALLTGRIRLVDVRAA